MKTILEAVMAVIEKHREARQWTDHAVASEVVDRLALDPHGPVPTPANDVEADPPRGPSLPPAVVASPPDAPKAQKGAKDSDDKPPPLSSGK